MKTNTIIMIAALAAMFAGCGKESEGDGCIKLSVERMAMGGSKVVMDPDNVNGASWVADEQIDLNGSPCTIKGNSTDGFYLDGMEPLAVDMYAVYPAAVNAGGNHIAVSNNGATACGVNIHSLSVEFVDGNSQKVVFPMAAKAVAHSGGLGFRHLTGGIRLTLKNTRTDADLNVARLVVTATTAAGEPAIYKDLCPTEDGYIPDCGAICRLITESTGVEPRFFGKPFKETVDMIAAVTGVAAAEMGFVGDRLYTDVAVGVNNGAKGFLVLTGEATMQTVRESDVVPTCIYESLDEMRKYL